MRMTLHVPSTVPLMGQFYDFVVVVFGRNHIISYHRSIFNFHPTSLHFHWDWGFIPDPVPTEGNEFVI